MEDFGDVAKARTSYTVFVEAMNAGREIMRRAGVPDPPPVPEFDAVFRRLTPAMRQDLYTALATQESPPNPVETIRLWQPFIRGAFGSSKSH